MKKSFMELYNELNSKFCVKMEEQQKKQKKMWYIAFGIYAIILLLMIVSKVFMFIPFVTMFFFIITFIVIALASNKATGGTSYYKENVINALVTNVFEKAIYTHNIGIRPHEYNGKAFMERYYDRYNSEDLVVTHNEFNLTFSEVHTEDRQEDSDGDTHYVTLFHGIYGYCNISKEINTNICITSNRLFGGKTKVKMDMPEFEKTYDVYTDDKIVAVQLLTADVMTELLDLKEKLGFMFEIVIERNQILFRIHSGNLFEMAVFKNSMGVERLHKYYNTLEHVEKITTMINKNIQELNI